MNNNKRLRLALTLAVCLVTSLLPIGQVQAGSVRYVYDELNRLSQVLYDDGTLVTYTYDQVGNRLIKDVTVIQETLSIPLSPSGPTSGVTSVGYSFTTGGSESNLGHSLEYQFDWKGDGTDLSSWGSASQSKTWSVGGSNGIRARSRCARHPTLTSGWSEALSVNMVLPSITLLSPSNNETFNACSLTKNYQPSFGWNSIGPFTNSTILFSTSSTDFRTQGVRIASATIAGDKSSWTPTVDLWKMFMTKSNNKGTIRDICWKVVGKRPDQTVIESEARGFRVGSPQKVTINTPSNGVTLPSSTPPTFNFDSNCNVKFRLEFSSSNDYWNPRKTTGFVSTTKDPTVGTVVNRTLTMNQWKSVKQLAGTEGYFRIKAWDGINRETVSEVKHFTIQ